MGPRETPPPLPELIANMQDEGHYELHSYASECNWLHSFEGDYDTIHVSFLHRGSEGPEDIVGPDPSLDYYALKTRWARFTMVDTEFGCTSGCNRPAEDGATYWRIAHFLFPFYAMIPGSFRTQSFIAVVPIDDEHCLRFSMSVLQEGRTRRQGGPGLAELNGIPTGYFSDPSKNTTDWLGRFNMAGNVRNDYLIDREVQAAGLPGNGGIGWSGIPGRGQDGAMTESMGTIYQRDNEHLGVTDSGIIRMRRLLINHARALRDHGTLPPAVDKPELYRVRSACVIYPDGVDGIEASKNLQWQALAEAPRLEAKA
jgi:hypothetical protein